MTRLFGLILATFLSLTLCFASHYVSGYQKKDGTYVKGHYSMDPYESKSTGLSYSHNKVVKRGEYKQSNDCDSYRYC
jgi:hypothetical protein